jgi:hypothetical protein
MSSLSFNFKINDPSSNKVTNIIANTSENYVSHTFLQIPIYDDSNKEIGYKVADDYIQKIGNNKYLVRINSTYVINNEGTISWQYNFVNDKPEVFYPVGVLATSNIISTTGNYINKSGSVFLYPYENGRRDIYIGFNYN